MWTGRAVWVLAWAWVCALRLSHAHSTQEDPHLDPKKVAVLTSLRQTQEQHQLSNHLALEVQGGEQAARALAHKYGLHYVGQVFTHPPIFHLHKPINTTHHHHHHHHHRERRATSDLVQLLANERGVKWVNQERAIIRDKRHQIPGFPHTSSGVRPDVASTHETKQQAYRHMRLWQEEEELGLSSKLGSLRRKTHSNFKTRHSYFKRGGINVRQNLPSSIFPLPTNKTETGEEQLIQSTRKLTTNNEEEFNYNEESLEFNDPLYKMQWYLHNTGQLGHPGYDLNVTGVWRQGYTGRGITLSILDDGFQTTNADLAANYNPAVSYSVVHDGQPENDPSPRLDPPNYSNSHGTYCAGVVAAVANNGVCGVGVAYNAKVGEERSQNSHQRKTKKN